MIQNEILDWLNQQDNIFAWRNNSVGVYDARLGVFRKNRNRFAIGGTSDVLGICGGRLLAVEVKKPGGVVSAAQAAFINKIIRMGGIAFIAFSLDDCKSKLHSYLKEVDHVVRKQE